MANEQFREATKKIRLIDANAMREEWLENGENEYVYDTNSVLDSIDAQPTVDAVEVVHGRWEKRDANEVYTSLSVHLWRCSVCKRGVPYGYTGFHYCPNCGAKMDKNENP